MSCSTVPMPSIIANASGADLLKDLKNIPDITALTAAPTGITLDTIGDNSNIYKLLLTAGSLDVPSVTTSGSGTSATYTHNIDAQKILEAFKESDNATNDQEVETLLTSYGFTPLANITGTSEPTLKTAITNFQNKVKFTYCAYEKMYKQALIEFFGAPNDTEKKKRAIILNLKLTILIVGLNRIQEYFKTKSAVFMAQSNANNDIASTTTRLTSQLNTLTAKDADRALYKRMVEYTEEKNQAHRNLLGLYSVLNLVALGVLFYIARN